MVRELNSHLQTIWMGFEYIVCPRITIYKFDIAFCIREGAKSINNSHKSLKNLRLLCVSFYIKFGTLTNIIQHLIRLSDTSKATKERVEKIGQQKLGPGGYSNLEARYVSIKNPKLHPNNI